MWLTRNTPPVGGLVQATGQDLERSPRSREILTPLGLGDELRAALITGGDSWGFMCLHRDRSSPPFTVGEAAFLKAIFEKVGVRSRQELAGQLFAQQYQPRIAAGRDLDTNGWFT